MEDCKKDGFYFDDFTISANESSAGIEELNFDFVVYPNPTNDLLNIATGSSMSGSIIYLLNELGQLVKTTEINDNSNTIQINTQGLSNGVYHLYISNGASHSIMKKVTILK